MPRVQGCIEVHTREARHLHTRMDGRALYEIQCMRPVTPPVLMQVRRSEQRGLPRRYPEVLHAHCGLNWNVSCCTTRGGHCSKKKKHCHRGEDGTSRFAETLGSLEIYAETNFKTLSKKMEGVAPSMLKILWSEFLAARHLLSGAPKELLGSV